MSMVLLTKWSRKKKKLIPGIRMNRKSFRMENLLAAPPNEHQNELKVKVYFIFKIILIKK